MTEAPIEFDLARIEDALRTIARVISTEHYHPNSPTPETEIGRLIANPMAEAAGMAHARLYAYLVSTIGKTAADEITLRISVEALRDAAPTPSTGEATH